MTVKPTRWIAARDGVAHAVVGRSFNAVCGVRATLERLAWPATGRCARCSTVIRARAA